MSSRKCTTGPSLLALGGIAECGITCTLRRCGMIDPSGVVLRQIARVLLHYAIAIFGNEFSIQPMLCNLHFVCTIYEWDGEKFILC